MARKARRQAFEQGEYDRRLARVRQWMSQDGIDLLFLTQMEHINWLSGFDPTAQFYFQAMIVTTDETREPSLIVNRAEEGLCLDTSWVDDVEIFWTFEDQIARARTFLADRELGKGARRIGLSLSGYNLRPIHLFGIQSLFEGATFVDATPPLDELRLVKSAPEIAYLRRSAFIADAGVTAGIHATRVGATDFEVMAAIQSAVTTNGGEYPSFPFLTSGRGIVHSIPTGRVFAPGDHCFFEVSGVYRRYHCNEIRTVLLGPVSDHYLSELNRTRDTVAEAVSRCTPGTSMPELVAVFERTHGLRDNISRFGFGMEIAYPPIWIGALSVMRGDNHVLEPGIVLTLETGTHDNEKGYHLGMGVNVLVTEHGPEVLNNVPLGPFFK